MTQPAYFSLRVAQVVTETVDSRSLVFDVPLALREQFAYKPGQFLTLRVPFEGGWLPRCYSLSSTPLQDEPLRVTIKQVRDGRASNWLCRSKVPPKMRTPCVPAPYFSNAACAAAIMRGCLSKPR